jgi:hypothetical protein
MSHITTIIGDWICRLGHARSWKAELRAMERLCLEQAELCVLPESRKALRLIALNYRAAAIE